MIKVVIVEDEEILRQLMAEELQKRNFEVHTAADGAQGWDLIQQVQPELVLLDLLMPAMSGYEVLEKIRQDESLKDVCCIVISNSGQANDLSRAFALGADDVLIKTDFNPDQLVDKIEELLAKDNQPHS